MILSVEHLNAQVVLVELAQDAAPPRVLAHFVDREAAERFKAAYAMSMQFTRTMESLGL